MKIYAFLFAILLSLTAHCQLFQAFVSGGMNLSQIEGDEVSGFKKAGWTFSAGVMLPLQPGNLKGRWRASLELVYSQRGAYESRGTGIKAPFGYTLNLQSVDIPLLVYYKDPHLDLMFGLGFQYGRLFKITEEFRLPDPPIRDRLRPADVENLPDFNPNEFSIVADCRFGVWKRLKISARWQYGLTPIRKNVTFKNGVTPGSIGYLEQTRDFHNHWLTLRAVYVINERLSTEKDRRINRNIY
jgi:hypothetical protein